MNIRTPSGPLALRSVAAALLLLGSVGCVDRRLVAPGTTTLQRTELYFGLSRSYGTDVTDAEWQGFVDDVITPRFPDGLTIVTGAGQWKESGKTIRESTRVVILLYEPGFEAFDKIEQIRRAYKVRFHQESVLRADSTQRVSF